MPANLFTIILAKTEVVTTLFLHKAIFRRHIRLRYPLHIHSFIDRKPKSINGDPKLKKFLDESGPDGVIYVSFGSVLKASVMSDDKRKTLLNVFGKLKQKVLWKWETDKMEDKPPNVMLHKWLPQQDVLGHPNVKLFISHAGQSSFQETLCHQKPAVSNTYFKSH